ncbi:MAG: biopolymer transporter ExbD [Planctomycetota bacterium]|nr:biopolymer transporter ExbD [Planctomycetota bacterium]MDA1166096.1 biopolymer transporter ExbD [Planctomycetota bacterium]
MTRSRSVSFNVTSLIDIVFLLIIFFLVASHVARSEAVEPVDLPKISDPAGDEEQAPRRIVVTVMADRSMWVGGRQVALPQVEQLILSAAQESRNEIEVRIRADHAATYSTIEPVLLACAQFGVTRVGFAVLPKSP